MNAVPAVRAVPRSILYTPALDARRLESARRYDADLYLVDLEDSVPAPRKPEARRLCAEFLGGAGVAARAAVRINPLRTPDYAYDLAALLQAPAFPAFVFMTMVRAPAEVEVVREALAEAGHRPELYVTLETLEAVAAADEIAAACDGMILGSADLGTALGVEITWASMLYARQRMVHATARHGIGCIDTGCFRIGDAGALREECERARELGFHGKGTVHPGQLAEINRVFRPREEELAAAREVIAASERHQDELSVLDGGLVGPPFVKRARWTIEMAEAWERRFPCPE
ncbi:MAG TPA: CoA ester lyase [Longimicrobium sp.]|nr:CoA ester lyase [Longimicrobium sp.]